MKLKHFAPLALTMWLAACATQHPAPNAIKSIPDAYSVSGRVAVRASGKGYPAAHFDWSHSGRTDRVDISNPLGQIVARLELSPDHARYLDSDGKAHEADDIEALTERELGWRLPAEGLRFWLLGLPAPGTPAKWQSGANGPALEQDGWHIEYTGDAGNAPTGIELNRPDLDIRIVLSDWQLPAS